MIRRDFFLRDDSHAIPMGIACYKLLPDDWLGWEPRTVYEELERLGFGKITESNACKLNAFRTARATILPWQDWHTFEKVVRGLNGDVPNFALTEPLSVAKCMVGVDSLRAIQSVPFSRDVMGYIAACARNDDLDYVPDPLTFVMPLLCPQMYRCEECGNTDTDDLEDGQCDVCTGRYEDGIPNGKPSEGLAGRGKHITRFMPYDYAPIATLFGRASRISIDHVQLGESSEELQVAKLLSYNEYRLEYKRRMNEQIREVAHVQRTRV